MRKEPTREMKIARIRAHVETIIEKCSEEEIDDVLWIVQLYATGALNEG